MQISVDLDISATLDWHYHCWAASDSGSADLKLSGASVSYAPHSVAPLYTAFSHAAALSPCRFLLLLNISSAAPFYPILVAQNVDAAVADISFKLHGGASWLYNLFVSSFKSSIKSSIVASLNKAVNTDAINQDLARIPEVRTLTRYATPS